MKKLNLARLLKKRNNGGFTLVEVVISCALLGILVVGVFSFATPVMSMVSSGRKNANATMLAETIDSYLAGMLKNAKLVEVFQYTSIERAKDTGTAGLKSAAGADEGLNKIDKFMGEGSNASEYEVRCIAISWTDDARAGYEGKRKLMLTNNTVDNTKVVNNYNLNITNVSKVFDDVLYDGLYPIIRLENFGPISGTASGSSSSSSSSSSGGSGGTWVNGYKILIDIYGDDKCYNVTSDDERLKSKLAFRSTSFVKCLNMTEGATDVIIMPADKKVQSTINGNKDKDFPSGVTGVPAGEPLKYTVDSNEFYYPDTYIYYVVPVKSLSTPAAPPAGP